MNSSQINHHTCDTWSTLYNKFISYLPLEPNSLDTYRVPNEPSRALRACVDYLNSDEHARASHFERHPDWVKIVIADCGNISFKFFGAMKRYLSKWLQFGSSTFDILLLLQTWDCFDESVDYSDVETILREIPDPYQSSKLFPQLIQQINYHIRLGVDGDDDNEGDDNDAEDDKDSSSSENKLFLEWDEYKPEFYWFRYLLSTYWENPKPTRDNMNKVFEQLIESIFVDNTTPTNEDGNSDQEEEDQSKNQQISDSTTRSTHFLDPLFGGLMNQLSNSYEEVEFYKELDELQTDEEKIEKLKNRPPYIQFPDFSKAPHPVHKPNRKAMLDNDVIGTQEYQRFFILMFAFGKQASLLPLRAAFHARDCHFDVQRIIQSMKEADPRRVSHQYGHFLSILQFRLAFFFSNQPIDPRETLNYPDLQSPLSFYSLPFQLLQVCHQILPHQKALELRNQLVSYLLSSTQSNLSTLLPPSPQAATPAEQTRNSIIADLFIPQSFCTPYRDERTYKPSLNIFQYLSHLATRYQLTELSHAYLFIICSGENQDYIQTDYLEPFIKLSYHLFQTNQPTLHQLLMSVLNTKLTASHFYPIELPYTLILAPFLSEINTFNSDPQFCSTIQPLLNKHILLCVHAGFLNPIHSISPDSPHNPTFNALLQPVRSFLYAWLQHKTQLSTMFNSTSTDCDNNLSKLLFFILEWQSQLCYFDPPFVRYSNIIQDTLISNPYLTITSFAKSTQNPHQSSLIPPPNLLNPLSTTSLNALNITDILIDQTTGLFLYVKTNEENHDDDDDDDDDDESTTFNQSSTIDRIKSPPQFLNGHGLQFVNPNDPIHDCVLAQLFGHSGDERCCSYSMNPYVLIDAIEKEYDRRYLAEVNDDPESEYDFEGYRQVLLHLFRQRYESSPNCTVDEDEFNKFHDTLFKEVLTPQVLFEIRNLCEYELNSLYRSDNPVPWVSKCRALEPLGSNLADQFLYVFAFVRPVRFSSYSQSQRQFPQRFHNPLNNTESQLVHGKENQKLLNSRKIRKLESTYQNYRQELSQLEKKFVAEHLLNVLLQADYDQLFDSIPTAQNNYDDGDENDTFRSYSFPHVPHHTEYNQSFYLELLLVASLGIQPQTKMMMDSKQTPLPQYHHIQQQYRLLDASLSQSSASTTPIPMLSPNQEAKIQQYFNSPKQQMLIPHIFAIPPVPYWEELQIEYKQYPWYGANDFFTHHIATSVLDCHSILFDFFVQR